MAWCARNLIPHGRKPDKVWTRPRPPARRSSPPQPKRRSTRRGSSYAAAARSASCGSATLFVGSPYRSTPRFYISSTSAPAGRPARSSHRIRQLSWAAASYLLLARRSPGALVWGPAHRQFLLWRAAPLGRRVDGVFWCSLFGQPRCRRCMQAARAGVGFDACFGIETGSS